MAIFVNTNVSSLHGQRYLNNVNNSLNTTYQRLSSGLRINSAKDDAAGLQIADRLTTQINGLNQGNRNASDGIALMQTMEGGMDEISSMLQRMRTLAVQSANGTITSDDRGAIQKEVGALSSEITRIAAQTTYGGKKILMGAEKSGTTTIGQDTIFSNINGVGVSAATKYGAAGRFTLQVGANSGDKIDMSVQSFELVSMMQLLSTVKADAAGANAGQSKVTAGAALGTVIGTLRSGGAIANTDAVKVNEDLVKAFGVKLVTDNTGAAQTKNAMAVSFALSTQEGASAAIRTIDALIAQVDGQRADLGAAQNRLESSIRNQSNVSTNSADARSRIRDTDFAEESAALSQQNIIQQAATSMLMQANMRPQLGLSLLG